MQLQTIKASGRFQGRRELIRHMEGQRITRSAAMKAKCFECMGGYQDGGVDCRISDCPLHPYMPFRDRQGPENSRSSKV